MITFLIAAFASFLWWQERDDDTERVMGLDLTSGFWTGLILAFGACLIREHHVHLIWFAVAFGLFAYVVTASHNILLSPPDTQKITKPRDIVQRFLFYIFAKSVGDPVGHPLYWTFSTIRIAFPVSGMGAALSNDALLIAGPVVSLAYYPWVHSERSKYVRAAVAGFLIMGAMAWGMV